MSIPPTINSKYSNLIKLSDYISSNNNKGNNNNNNTNNLNESHQSINELFKVVELRPNNIVKVYVIDNKQYSIIRIKNNKLYRVIGPHLIEIMINNIPSNWVLKALFKNESDENLLKLYHHITNLVNRFK